jgi:lycopene cyclase domain-containing protein
VTYGSLLALFLAPPLVLAAWANRRLDRRGAPGSPWGAVAALALVALVYTTPWDNYLVASGVWWYQPSLVNGLTFGWVPAEEYAFFVLQTLLTGLWTALLLRTCPAGSAFARLPGLRLAAAGAAVAFGVAGGAVLAAGWRPSVYAGLILAWGMIPLAVQFLHGADVLAKKGRVLVASVLVPTAYLWLVDGVALAGATWTLSPLQTTGLALGPLPVEEMLFFLVTNGIVACGAVLLLLPGFDAGRRAEGRIGR